MVYSSVYRRAYKEPSWDDYSKKEFFSKLQYRSDRRSVEHRHQPWRWDSENEDENIEEIPADDGSYDGGRRHRERVAREENPLDGRIPKQAWEEERKETRKRDHGADNGLLPPEKLTYDEEGAEKKSKQSHLLKDNAKLTNRDRRHKDDHNHTPDKALILREKVRYNQEEEKNRKQSQLVGDDSRPQERDHRSNEDEKKYRPRSTSPNKVRQSKAKRSKVPFLPYGMANEGPVDMWKTHNVLASKPEVYPAALRAQKRRQQEIKKKAQLREQAIKKKVTPGHFDEDVAYPKTWWLTEYQRNYCKEEDVKRHFLR